MEEKGVFRNFRLHIKYECRVKPDRIKVHESSVCMDPEHCIGTTSESRSQEVGPRDTPDTDTEWTRTPRRITSSLDEPQSQWTP